MRSPSILGRIGCSARVAWRMSSLPWGGGAIRVTSSAHGREGVRVRVAATQRKLSTYLSVLLDAGLEAECFVERRPRRRSVEYASAGEKR